jgi:hypothetical protein
MLRTARAFSGERCENNTALRSFAAAHNVRFSEGSAHRQTKIFCGGTKIKKNNLI